MDMTCQLCGEEILKGLEKFSTSSSLARGTKYHNHRDCDRKVEGLIAALLKEVDDGTAGGPPRIPR